MNCAVMKFHHQPKLYPKSNQKAVLTRISLQGCYKNKLSQNKVGDYKYYQILKATSTHTVSYSTKRKLNLQAYTLRIPLHDF